MIVLAVVALLTIMVTEFTFNTQLDQHRTRNAVHALQAQLLARSGINLAEGFLMLDEEPTYDAYTEDWFHADGASSAASSRSTRPCASAARCATRAARSTSTTRASRAARSRAQAVTASAVLRDAMRCMFERRGIDVEVVDKLADYWEQEGPPQGRRHRVPPIPDFTSIEDFGATFRIPSAELQKLRAVLTAQPRALLPRINVNTAPAEVLAAVLNAEQERLSAERRRPADRRAPARSRSALQVPAAISRALSASLDNANIKTTLFGVQSRLFRLEASALTNVDPDNPDSGGIGQTVSALVARQTSLKPKAGNNSAPQVGANGKPLPNWTLRPLDWQKEGGARLFRPTPGEDEDQPGTHGRGECSRPTSDG